MKVKEIEWGEEMPSSEECHYNHIIGKTDLFSFWITWKSWKDCANYDLEACYGTDTNYLDSYWSIEDAKKAAQDKFNELILSCIEVE